jgi:type VI secretion system protein ImpA
MASVAELDLTGMTGPIPGDNPAGVDLREDEERGNEFRRIRDARNDARRYERRADDGGDDASDALPKAMAEWRTVVEVGERALAEWSKDLEVAAYLIEGLARTEGFGGVARAFRITRELVENYWDSLYPLPDEDGLSTRVLPLTWLNGTESEGSLTPALARIPLTEGSSEGPFALWQYNQAVEIASTTDPTAREDRLRQGAATMEKIDRACSETAPSFFIQLLQDIEDCQSEFKQLDALLTEKCGYEHAPPTSRIMEMFDQCLEAAREISKKRLADAGVNSADVTGNGPAGAMASEGHRGGGAGPLSTRDDAFRILLSVADFFERTEPQSILPAQIRRVVRWGRMSPQELFGELLEDPGALDNMFKLVGMSRPESNES